MFNQQMLFGTPSMQQDGMMKAEEMSSVAMSAEQMIERAMLVQAFGGTPEAPNASRVTTHHHQPSDGAPDAGDFRYSLFCYK